MYIHERSDWPHFSWNLRKIDEILIQLRHHQGRLMGGMGAIGFPLRDEALLLTLTEDVVQSSAIEGNLLDPSLVRSSVARHLGMETAASPIDRHIEGVVQMLLDATQKFDQPLTRERLWGWHGALFPTGWSGFTRIKVGEWRKGPVQVVSGTIGREIVHFEAPLAERVDGEMGLFLEWINGENKMDLILQAAVAHLWFITIHPFEDGNGRIARAIADMLLSRSEQSPDRFYSLSSQIQRERKSYYSILEKSQKNGVEITPWIEWLLMTLKKGIERSLITLDTIVHKSRVWASLTTFSLNNRQRKVINCLLDGFEGKLTTSKWAKIAQCSQDSAYRDILDLVDRTILVKHEEGGRSTNYSLSLRYQR